MANIKDNLTAIVAPGVDNDVTQGYAAGSEWFDLSTASFWKCLDATDAAASWTEIAPEYPAWPVGTYKMPMHITTASDSSAITANLITMQPILIERRTLIDQVAMRVTTLQTGAAARLGIYNTDPTTCLPGMLVIDAGELDLSTFSGDRWRSISITLKPGLYWTACIMKSVTTMPTVRRVGGAVYGHFVAADMTELSSSSATRYLSASQTYGALPATAPTLVRDSGTHGPIISLRRAM
jgi:hypothetical protein